MTDGHRTDRRTKQLIGARATALPKKCFVSSVILDIYFLGKMSPRKTVFLDKLYAKHYTQSIPPLSRPYSVHMNHTYCDPAEYADSNPALPFFYGGGKYYLTSQATPYHTIQYSKVAIWLKQLLGHTGTILNH